MKCYHLIVSSRNKKSIINFEQFFFKVIKFNFNILNRFLRKKKRRKVFTILKSPHVNKIAQEQFEYKTYSQKYIIYFSNSSQFLLFFKKLKKHLFPDLEFKLNIFLHKKIDELSIFKLFNTKKYKLNIIDKINLSQNLTIEKKKKKFNESNIDLLIKTKKILKNVDVYGDLLLNKSNMGIN